MTLDFCLVPTVLRLCKNSGTHLFSPRTHCNASVALRIRIPCQGCNTSRNDNTGIKYQSHRFFSVRALTYLGSARSIRIHLIRRLSEHSMGSRPSLPGACRTTRWCAAWPPIGGCGCRAERCRGSGRRLTRAQTPRLSKACYHRPKALEKAPPSGRR